MSCSPQLSVTFIQMDKNDTNLSQRVGLGSLERKPPLLVLEAELYQLKASIKNFAAAIKKIWPKNSTGGQR